MRKSNVEYEFLSLLGKFITEYLLVSMNASPRFCSHKSVNNESEVDKGEKDNIKFIIAGENAAKAFDTPKQPLDLIALLVQLLIIVPGIFPVLLVNANWKMSFFAGMECHFLAVSMRWVCSLDYPLLVGLKPVKS